MSDNSKNKKSIKELDSGIPNIENLPKRFEELSSQYRLSLHSNDSNSIWVLSGDLVYDTICLKITDLENLRPTPVVLNDDKKLFPWNIDGRNIKSFDSCGAAFLLSCLRYAKKNRLKLQLIDLPESVFPLLQVQGVAGLISPLVKDVIY